MLAPIQKGLLFSKPPSSLESKTLNQNLVQHLKTSLSRTLDFFFPLAGRLATIKQHNDNTISFFIDCNNAGAQSLLAHVWRSVTRGRQLDPEEEISIRLVIGLRSRLKDPSMPEEYFGNALHGGVLAMKTRETLENGLGFVALEMSKMIRCCTEESIRNNLECWIKNPKLTTLSSS